MKECSSGRKDCKGDCENCQKKQSHFFDQPGLDPQLFKSLFNIEQEEEVCTDSSEDEDDEDDEDDELEEDEDDDTDDDDELITQR